MAYGDISQSGAGRRPLSAPDSGWRPDYVGNAAGEFADGFGAQLAQALENTVAVLKEAGAGPEHIVRMTWYVTDLDAYRNDLAAIGAAYRDVMGKNFPAMAVVGVTGLVEKDALIEIESTAVIER